MKISWKRILLLKYKGWWVYWRQRTKVFSLKKIFIICRGRLRLRGEWWRIWWSKREGLVRKLKERRYCKCRNKKDLLKIYFLHNKNSHNRSKKRELIFHVRHNNSNNKEGIIYTHISTRINTHNKVTNVNHPYTQHSTTTTTTTTATNAKFYRYFTASPIFPTYHLSL
mgnify:CR=1 FL=1